MDAAIQTSETEARLAKLREQEAKAQAKLDAIRAKRRSATAKRREARRKDDNRAKLLLGVLVAGATKGPQGASLRRFLGAEVKRWLETPDLRDSSRRDLEWLQGSAFWAELMEGKGE